MAQILFKGNPVHTNGNLPMPGTSAPIFNPLIKTDLSPLSLGDLHGKNIIMNIFPSIDTGVCATSVRKFNEIASKLQDTVVLCISRDLPFAHKRFCGAEGINNVVSLSDYRSAEFGLKYGVWMVDGALAGLFARALIVIDKTGNVLYSDFATDITSEPNYEAALQALGA